LDTLSLIHGDDFDNYLISKNQNSKIFVFDYSSFKKIKKYDFQYILADELLSITEREKIHQHVVSKLYWYEDQTLSDDQKQLFQFLDPLYLHQKLLVTLIQFSIIKKILEKEKPKKVFATKNLSKIISTINDKIPIVLLNDEKVEIFDKYDLRFKLFSKSISLKFSMSKLRKLQNFYESIICSFNKIWLLNNNKPIILLLEFDPSKFEKFFHEIKSNNFNCVILNRRKSPIINKNSLKILKNSNIKLFNFNNLLSTNEKKEISSLTNQYRVFLKNFWDNEKNLFNIFSFENSSYYLSIKDFLKKQFESEIEFNVQNLIQSKHIFKNFDIKCILYQYESGTSENITLSQRKNTPSLLIRHGFSSFSNKLDDLRWKYDQFRLLKLNCNQILVWGNSDYDFYSKFLPKNSLKKIGSPRHDNFFIDSKKKNDLEKTILITAPPIIEWTGQQNINLELRYENFLKSIIDDLQKHKNFKIIVKLHPGWGWKFNYTLLKICKNIDPTIPIFSTESIVELIDRSDMMININPEENQPSTVILEALIMKKPVINISLDESNSEFDYDGVSPVISLSYKTDIMKYVIKLFNDSKFYEELNKKITTSLNNYLSNHKNASKQLADYLKSYV
jgi:hypothetical protein